MRLPGKWFLTLPRAALSDEVLKPGQKLLFIVVMAKCRLAQWAGQKLSQGVLAPGNVDPVSPLQLTRRGHLVVIAML